MVRSPGARLATVALLVTMLAGCSTGIRTPLFRPATKASAPPSALARFYAQRLAWQDCGGGFQCATLQVPLDYAHPATQTIGVAVTRRRATGPDHRLGSILLNPGGPGGSGIDYARGAQQVLTPAVLAQYDVVGFDPRGVGLSAPVTCLDDQQMDAYVATVPDPQNQAEQDQIVAEDKLFAAQCQTHSAGLLPFVSTIDAARDMDILRQALGDQRLTYLGKSYGTFLGATYAELFPGRVGRLVLDGALDPRIGADQLGREQAAGIQLALRSFLANCATRLDCPLGANPVAAEQRLGAMFAAIRAHPLKGDATRMLDEALAEIGVIAALYTDAAWPLLRTSLRLALAGDGRGLLQLADSYDNRGPDGHYQSNEVAANLAINCLDRPGPSSPADIQAEVAAYEQASPTFGAGLAWSNLSCAYWPVPAVDRPHAIAARGAAPILVVGTIRDPATPYAWAQGLAAQLAAGRLLTYDGDGHTAYRRGSSCIDSAVDAYFLQGTLPASGTRCT